MTYITALASIINHTLKYLLAVPALVYGKGHGYGDHRKGGLVY